MTITEFNLLKADLDKAKRDEQRSRNEMDRCERLASSQQEQLETLLNHRDECVTGLRNAKESGLNIVQIREYQLLLKHLDTVVHDQQEKVDLSQVNYEKSRDDWVVKNEHLQQVSHQMEQAELERRKQREREINGEDQADDHDRKPSYGGIAGRRLKTS